MATKNEIADMIFRKAPGKDSSSYKNDLQMFNILTAMDGVRSVRAIAKQDFYELDVLAEKVGQLVDKGFLVPIHGADGESGIGAEALKTLQAELTKLVGPVAGMLLKDSAKKLGNDLAAFPLGRADELLDMVCKFIQDQSKAAQFKARMMSQIK
ncbi:MAG: hypothetical protein P8X55_04535 [Desulfosarcinaceae bacterium]|jgi:hypothetical protein